MQEKYVKNRFNITVHTTPSHVRRLAVLALFSLTAFAADKPNVLFLFTDDQRNDTIHAHGNEYVHTPHTDRLVKNGTSFLNAYIMGATSPAVCAPSRAVLMSGRTLWNAESQGLWSSKLTGKFKSLPQVFRDAGYVTFGTGKQHNGTEAFTRSFSAGSKIFFGGMTKSQYDLPLCAYSPDGNYKQKIQHKGTHSAEVYADATVAFLEKQADRKAPFFAYVAFQTPHDPRQAPKAFTDMYKPADIPLPVAFQPEHPFDNGMLRIRDEGLERFPRKPERIQKHVADYYAMVSHTDAQVGRILDALDKTGKKDNTIIVFSSDNGLSVGRHGLLGKQSVYEHAVRVPLIIAGPGIPKNETRKQLAYVYDVYPTLCERAGITTPDTVQFKSLNPQIKSAKAEGRNHLIFAFMDWQRSIRDARYKLIEYCVKNNRTTQLFDLNKDPHEMNNLAGNPEYAATLKNLRTLLQAECKRLNDGTSPYLFSAKQGKAFWGTYDRVKESATPQFNAHSAP